jgi:hypothetical protein
MASVAATRPIADKPFQPVSRRRQVCLKSHVIDAARAAWFRGIFHVELIGARAFSAMHINPQV